MSADYAPGTVAIATVRGIKGVRVMRVLSNYTSSEWASADGAGCRLHDSKQVTDIRPLVVLDLDDASAVLGDLNWAANTTVHIARDERLRSLRAQIEAQTKPPRIPEPTDCGATVIAAQTGEIEGSERLWVRFRHGAADCWIDQYEHVRSWDDLDSPKVQDCEAQS